MQSIQILIFDLFISRELFIDLLSKKYNLRVVKVSEILRKEQKSQSDLGLEIRHYLDKGELLPTELLNLVFKKNILIDNKDILIAGYPHTENQYHELVELLVGLDVKIDKIWYLKLGNPKFAFRKNSQKLIANKPDEYESLEENLFEMLRLKQKEYDKIVDLWNIKYQVSVVKVDYEKEKIGLFIEPSYHSLNKKRINDSRMF